MQHERNLTKEVYSLMHMEESFYKQKSRIQWLTEGDSNTNFFHKSVMVRQNRNTISILINSEGNRLSTFSQMAEEVIRYFQNLLGTEDNEVTGCPSIVLTELVNTIPAAVQEKLVKLVT